MVHPVTVPPTLGYYKLKSRSHLEFIRGFAPERPQRKQNCLSVVPTECTDPPAPSSYRGFVGEDQDRSHVKLFMDDYCEDRIGR